MFHNAYELAGIIIAAVTVLTFFGAIGRSIYKRGGAENSITSALNANTEATGRLTDAFASFREGVASEFRTVDVRLTRLETEAKVQVNVNGPSAHRNDGSEN